MTDEELPEYLHGSNTLENATWRLAVGLYQAQIKNNESKPSDRQIDIFSLEIKEEEDAIQGIITVTDLPVELKIGAAHFSAIEEVRISNYKPLIKTPPSYPWGYGNGGLDTFLHLLLQLSLCQVLNEYNQNSNNFIQMNMAQSTKLKSSPFLVSSTITLPMNNVLDSKDFICVPKEVLTGESPWKITTP